VINAIAKAGLEKTTFETKSGLLIGSNSPLITIEYTEVDAI
jgi:hypothetical protein